MSDYFSSEKFQAMVQDRYVELRSDASMNGLKGVVTNVAKGAAALKAEFSRLEAIYKVPKERPEELDIPIEEMEKLFHLATDVSAMCMLLSMKTVQPKSRQTKLSDLPENCIVIIDEGQKVIVTGARLKYMHDLYAAHTNRILAIPEEGKSIVDVVEENKEEMASTLEKQVGGNTKISITTSKSPKSKAGGK